MLKHLFSFSGCAGRLEYLIHSFTDIFGIIAVILALSIIEKQFNVTMSEEIVVFSILGVVVISVLAEVAVTVRRFHDLGMSGWYFFGLMVPFYNIYLGLILLFKRGEGHSNRYGSVTK